MGRTIPSYRISLEEELKRWERFRDFLRIDERVIFEDMMDEYPGKKQESKTAFT